MSAWESVICQKYEKVRSQQTACVYRNIIQSLLHTWADAPEKRNNGSLQRAFFVPYCLVSVLTIFCGGSWKRSLCSTDRELLITPLKWGWREGRHTTQNGVTWSGHKSEMSNEPRAELRNRFGIMPQFWCSLSIIVCVLALSGREIICGVCKQTEANAF